MSLESEWSYFYNADEISKAPREINLSVGEAERAHLLKRLGVRSLDKLDAKLVLRRQDGGRVVYIKGSLAADVVQSCVVSGDDVPAHIQEDFEAWYADPEDAVSLVKARRDKQAVAGHGEMPILDESEDPERIIDGQIDLGELVVQNLVLALDPYPHAPNAHYELGDDNYQEALPKSENPFAALKDWKDKLK